MSSKAQDSICWSCRNSVPKYDEKERRYTRGCNWSINHKAVKGWEAEPTRIKLNSSEKRTFTKSFLVKSCPYYRKG